MSEWSEDTSGAQSAQRLRRARPGFRTIPAKAAASGGGEIPKSLSDLAYDRFMAALLQRKVRPGSFVSQGELVRLLDVPVGPLRDALRVLQAEGLVSIKARSGIEVIKPDFAMARHTYQIRAILERTAVRVYAETAPLSAITEQEARHRAVLASSEGREASEEDFREMERVDHGFHMEIIAALKNPLVEDTYRRIHAFLRLILLERGFSGPIMARTIREHLVVLKACVERDPDAAEAALEQHFDRALQRAMGLF